jgi:hypothetical protein
MFNKKIFDNLRNEISFLIEYFERHPEPSQTRINLIFKLEFNRADLGPHPVENNDSERERILLYFIFSQQRGGTL